MAYMYEFQLKNNPVQTRSVLENKHVFFEEYKQWIERDWINLSDASIADIKRFIANKEQVVFKNALGGAGKSVKIASTLNFIAESLARYAKKHNYDLLEEFISQHNNLQRLSPNSLNTVRLITQINAGGGVEIIGAMLRMGINLNTDNLSTGGIACPIDPELGVITGPAISFDNTKPDYESHPVSCIRFEGFKIPYWTKIIEMCKEAALLHPENKSIGWDVAIKQTGPLLLEGNHDWGARLWQMPMKRGLKYVLEKY